MRRTGAGRSAGLGREEQEGLFTENSFRIDDGRKMAENLLDEGVDIILSVAEKVGLGAAAVVRERGSVYLIGVDSDWVIMYPEFADIMLTSNEKQLDVSVVLAVEAIVVGTFTGGSHTGTQESG